MQPETSQTQPKDLTKQAPTQSTPTEEASTKAPQNATKSARRAQILYIAIAVVVLGLFITFVVFMSTHAEATANIRDIAIVLVAIETSIIGLVAIVLIFQIQMLIQVLRDEIQPLLQSFNDTASTVRGTTEFVSQNMVSPIIKAAGFAAGVQRVTGDVFAIAKNLRPHSKSSRRDASASQHDAE